MRSLFEEIRSTFRLLGRAFGVFKWQIAALVGLSTVSGVLEGIGINAVIPLFSFASKNGVRGTDVISRYIESFFAFLHVEYRLRTLLFFIVFLFIVKAVTLYFATYIGTYISANYEQRARNEVFSAVLRADWPLLSKQKIGHLDQVLTTDVGNGTMLLAQATTAVPILVNLGIYAIVAMNISPVVAAFTAALGILLFAILRPLFRKNKIVSTEVAQMYKIIANFVSEHVIGMKAVKSLNVIEAVRFRGFALFERVKKLHLSITLVRGGTNAVLQPIGVIFAVSIFAFLYKTTTFNFASFAVLVYAINKVFSYIQLSQSYLHSVISLMPYIQNVIAYKEDAERHREIDIGKRAFVFRDALEFRDVSFSYDKEQAVLRDVNIVAKRGEMIGLIGPSGAGKTTVVDLLLRLYRPERGAIFLDGVDVADIELAQWRARIGYVSQDIFLLNDTIEQNIKFYNAQVTDADMIAAAKTANIYEFIEQQPRKFQTVVGERGTSLSVGQRQRIVLARILARKPDILILDEATSALDNESEVAVQKAIEQLRKTVTVIAIAHRLSTITASDRLIVLEHGRITEEGAPEVLLKDKASYFSRVFNIRE